MPHAVSRLPRSIAAIALAAASLAAAPAARAVGHRIDVEIVDRDSGEQLTPIFHGGAWWIAGRPGGRYAVMLANRGAARTLSVVSIDGVNALSGETAGSDQSGYVLDAYQSTRIDGWRKNLAQVAAFEFTALPDSYAARTGRPDNVGVIGVAVFDERPEPVAMPRADGPVLEPREKAAPLPAPAAAAPQQDGANRSSAGSAASDARADGIAARRDDRLGTGHGAIERSVVRWTQFERAQSTPNEIVAIRYDRRENLVAMGILPPPRRPPIAADPFPRDGAFVPDPPRHW